MPITVPNRANLRLTTGSSMEGNQPINAKAQAALRCGPVYVHANSPAANSGEPLVGFANGNTGRIGYLGFNIVDGIPAGSGVCAQKGVTVEGFAGLTPGLAVYVDDTALPGGFATDATATFSGLSHTQPAAGAGIVQARVGVAISTTRIRFD